METIKHLLGLCGENWHPNIFIILFIIFLIYETNISKIIRRSWWKRS
jgi:hypothetical protein